MRLTSKGRYGVSAMIDINNNGKDGKPVTLAAISERQFISLSYLEQLFRSLRAGGLVRSIRGPGGGYLLAHQANEITIADVIQAVNEPIRTTMCENAVRGCHRGKRCDTHQLWDAMGKHIYRFLHAVTIEMVCQKEVDLNDLELKPIENIVNEVVMEQKIAKVS